MKRLIFRYFSLLFLFLVIGVNLFGSENSKGEIPVPDKENIEKASDKFQVSMNPFEMCIRDSFKGSHVVLHELPPFCTHHESHHGHGYDDGKYAGKAELPVE